MKAHLNNVYNLRDLCHSSRSPQPFGAILACMIHTLVYAGECPYDSFSSDGTPPCTECPLGDVTESRGATECVLGGTECEKVSVCRQRLASHWVSPFAWSSGAVGFKFCVVGHHEYIKNGLNTSV